MKKNLFFLSLFSCMQLAAQTVDVVVKNSTKEARTDVPVVLNLSQLGVKVGSAVRPVVRAHIVGKKRMDGQGMPETVQEIPSQCNGDELLFLADLPQKAEARFSVELDEESQNVFDKRVHAHLKLWDKKFRYPRVNEIEFQGDVDPRASYDAIYGHGAMWESEYVGFRVYMDNRQSIDLYGKKHLQLELDTVNFYSNRELLATGYGQDILWAGQSIGAGSFRGLRNGQPAYIDSVAARGQRIVENGPLRTVVEVWDRDWKIDGKTLQMTQRYTMYAGHRDVQVDIFLEGAADTDLFVTGVQKLEMENEGIVEKSGLVGSWGRNVPEKGSPDLVEGLGIGVYVEPKYVARVVEDELNYLVHIHPVNGHVRYYLAVAADMQLQGGIHDAKTWFEYLRAWREQLRKPCTVILSGREKR